MGLPFKTSIFFDVVTCERLNCLLFQVTVHLFLSKLDISNSFYRDIGNTVCELSLGCHEKQIYSSKKNYKLTGLCDILIIFINLFCYT